MPATTPPSLRPSTLPLTGLPPGWTLRVPDERDVHRLAGLRAAVTDRAVGGATPDTRTVLLEITGVASWTRRQAVAVDPGGCVRGWAAAHDRAAGRVLAHVTVEPDLDAQAGAGTEDAVARALLAWVERAARAIAHLRRLGSTQIDTGSYAGDDRQGGWLRDAGFRHTRTWLQMSRPVDRGRDHPSLLPAPREGVRVRRVRLHTNGLPVAEDIQLIHEMLEESFADHFNSYRESFPEFVQRLQEDPGHRWDSWWLAEVRDDAGDDGWLAGGALVGTVLAPDREGFLGGYVDYIGVHRRARGRGVAKALLHTAIGDAALQGRNRVGLEVDDDSPTRADALYRSLGWETAYRTCSWHRDVVVGEPG
ncbi:GNAT family N-acetyltransferase [Arsenicicoccus sp. oral taxon 190]|uniref:GNAT family N-acetyltransferase n=1 Tax=Arsenicicoccus sp. oral taxon 190 TaxID=1658671 RepID=UPI00067A0231|nr:GNAT family N-acetyltransferase [Arsenicicoccus sp. oral taxon 190]AKT51614.1 GCN5 family acetyltransferase [Arsenicicoccus sp. oral taxon 190]